MYVRTVRIFSNTHPCYEERMAFMSNCASIWMLTLTCNLELLPKENHV